MAVKSTILAVLAAAGVALAQTATVCSNSTITIQSNGDISQISSCGILSGNLVIGSGCTGDLSLGAVQQIGGNLQVVNAVGLTSLSAPSLQSISGSFTLTNLTILNSLSFAELSSVGSIKWTTLPHLSQLSFTTGVTQANSVTISDTVLQTLSGITLDSVSMMDINNNFQLQTINMQLQNVKTSLNIAFNSKNVAVQLPNLKWAQNFTCYDCGQISVPSLAAINGSMGLTNNTFTSFSAPNLTTVGQSISFVSNVACTNISVPQLTTIGGGFVIANNTQLTSVDGFPDVQTVGGAVDFTGTFQNVTLPALKQVSGGFVAESTNSFDCSAFNSLHSAGKIQGNTYECKPNATNPTSSSGVTTSGGSGSSSSSSGNKKSAAGRVEAVTGAVLGLVTFIAFLTL